MSYAAQMLDTYEHALDVDAGVLATGIEVLADCAQACSVDTDANLGEQNVAEMVRCIRLCLNCADICAAAAAVMSRPATAEKGVIQPLLTACAAICRSCGDECARHARMHPHCRVCEGACRRAEQASSDLLRALK
jgi:uncharacterized membrane protein